MSNKDKTKILILIALWIAAFLPIYPEMVSAWLHDSDNSHAFLVPFISLYFVWQKRMQLEESRISSARWGAILLVFSLAVYLVSFMGGIAFTARLALVFSLLGFLWFCLGNQCTRILAFPVLFLLFMVPVPYSVMSPVSMPLQLLATKVATSFITACSIPVYREGNLLFFTNTQLEVAEACSGIRSIMSLTMLAVIFAYLSRCVWKKKVVLIVSAIPIALLANIIRVSATGILASKYGDKVAKGFLHEFSGLVVFAFGFLFLLLIFSLINRKHDDSQ